MPSAVAVPGLTPDITEVTLSDPTPMNRPIIDLHAHLHPFSLSVGHHTPDDLLRDMDLHGIERASVSSALAILYNITEGNELLARDIAAHDRLLGYVFANPNDVDASIEQIRRYLERERYVGVKMYSGGYIGRPLDCPEHRTILEVVAAEFPHSLVLFHCGENDPANYAGLASVSAQFPNLTFLAGHMGSKLWRQALPVLAPCPNVVAEISAPVPARHRIEDAVRVMGADRVVFGSDFPIIRQGYMLGCVTEADITDAQRAMILHDNAARMLRRD